MAVAQKRLPLRCILCRAKILRIKQDHRGKDGTVVQSKDELVHSDTLSGLPKSVSGYNITNYISSSGSNYSFTSGQSTHISTILFCQKLFTNAFYCLSLEFCSYRYCSEPSHFLQEVTLNGSSSSAYFAFLSFVTLLVGLTVSIFESTWNKIMH